MNKTIRRLVSQHRSQTLPTVVDLSELGRRLSTTDPSALDSVSVTIIKARGKALFVSEELFQTLQSQGELALSCLTNSR